MSGHRKEREREERERKDVYYSSGPFTSGVKGRKMTSRNTTLGSVGVSLGRRMSKDRSDGQVRRQFER
jgi:hypothetical protein